MQKKVLIDIKDKNLFDYEVPDDIKTGAIVTVPFKRQTRIGIISDEKIDDKLEKSKIKPILGQIENFYLPKVSYDFLKWFSDYNMASMGQALKMFIPSGVLKEVKKPLNQTLEYQEIELSSPQERALKEIDIDGFKVNVLHGVTGSGKTEVYFSLINETLKQGKQVLVMLPEIALTTQFEERFFKRFKEKPLLWHSEIGLKDKKAIWQGVLNRTVKVVAGARSGLFLPFSDLGLIIVDEEHDQSYKQEDGISYQGRDMAITRAYLGDIPIVLSTATPSLETIANIKLGKYKEIKIPVRFNDAKMPIIKTIDLRENDIVKLEGGQSSCISEYLLTEIKNNLALQEQTLLFLNRRGYSPITLCKSCGEKLLCKTCSVALVYHKEDNTYRCHLCGQKFKHISKCPSCGEEGAMISVGAGIEKIEEALKELVPEARILSLSTDNFNRKQALETFNKIVNKEIDIIIGTQILAKGHHFPNLTLVGVIDADLSTNVDLRSSERTYQLLEQVSGRAGREQKQGRVFLQSYDTSHPVIKSLLSRDIEGFIINEMKAREVLKMPPFGKLAALIISGSDEEKAKEVAEKIGARAKYFKEVAEIYGPIPAAIYKLKSRYRFRILIKTKKEIKIQKVIFNLLKEMPVINSVRIKIDIDPYNFM